MGVQHSAKAVIGMWVNFPLYEEVERKRFDRKYPPGAKFDQKTGEPLYELVDEPVAGYDPDAKSGTHDGAFHGYPVIQTLDADDDDVAFIVGLVFAESDQYRSPGDGIRKLPEDLNEQIAAFQKTMTAAGVWDPELFGLWSVLLCG